MIDHTTVAFVSGANRGLGAQFVVRLLARGAGKVYAASRTGDTTIRDARVVPIALDVTDDASVARAAIVAADTTLLINNAGVNRQSAFFAADAIDNARTEIEVNYFGLLCMSWAFRHARHAKRLRLIDIAERIGWSESMLSKIENDRVMPSIGMLHRLVSELGTNIGALLDSSESEPTSWITHNHERPVIPRASSDPSVAGVSLEWLTPFPVPNLFQSAIHIIEPGARSDGEVHHQGEDFGYIMHGSIELSIDGQIHILEEGDSFFFPSDLPHAYSNPGATVARVLWFNTPPTF